MGEKVYKSISVFVAVRFFSPEMQLIHCKSEKVLKQEPFLFFVS